MTRGTTEDLMPYDELGFWGRYWRRVRTSMGAPFCAACFRSLPGARRGDVCSDECAEDY